LTAAALVIFDCGGDAAVAERLAQLAG